VALFSSSRVGGTLSVGGGSCNVLTASEDIVDPVHALQKSASAASAEMQRASFI
jgi:hypothetical protein